MGKIYLWIALALVSELLAALSLIPRLAINLQISFAVALHLFCGFCFAMAEFGLQAYERRRPHWMLPILSASLSWLLPVLGSITLLLLWYYRLKYLVTEDRRDITQVNLSEEFVVLGRNTSRFGVGGARARIENANLTAMQTADAVLAISTVKSPEHNALLRKTLRHSLDEIRLLAFSLLHKQENDLFAHISDLLALYRDPHDVAEKARAAKQLALSYWELVYMDLVQEQLRDSCMDYAEKYANEALQRYSQDHSLWTCLGKIHLERGDLDAAEQAMLTAEKFQAPSWSIQPFLAEIFFLQRNWQKVTDIFATYPELRYIPKLSGVTKFWRSTTS